MAELDREVAGVLPLGSSKVQRLVLDAVAEYLRRRRAEASEPRRRILEDETREMIIEALAGYSR